MPPSPEGVDRAAMVSWVVIKMVNYSSWGGRFGAVSFLLMAVMIIFFMAPSPRLEVF